MTSPDELRRRLDKLESVTPDDDVFPPVGLSKEEKDALDRTFDPGKSVSEETREWLDDQWGVQPAEEILGGSET